MKNLKYFLIGALLLIGIPVLASTASPWNFTNLTDGFIKPTNVNGTVQGVIVSASSTIGGGTAKTGLTINGSATTTSLKLLGITGSTQCLEVDSTGKIVGAGSACGTSSGGITSIATSWPITGGTITTIGTIGFGGLSTTSNFSTKGQLPYITGVHSFGTVGTSTLTASSPLTGSFTHVGSTGSIGCQTASGSQAGCLSAADWTTFNGKGSGSVTSVATNNGLTGGTITTTGTIGLATIAAHTLLANQTSATAVPVAVATSSVSQGTGITITGSGSLVGGAGLSVALTSNTISGITLGSNLNSLSHDSTLTGTSFNGSAAVSNWGLDLTHANTWTGKQTFTYASTTGISGSYASSSKAFFGILTLPSINGSTQCLHVDTNGKITGTGSDCGSGSGAVSSVSNSDSTLTISPTTGSVVASLNLAHANTWTGLQTFGNSTTTRASFTYASSTKAFFGTLNLPGLTGTQCLHEVSGLVSGTGSDCGSGSGAAFPFTPTTNFGRAVNATTSTIWFKDPGPTAPKFALIASGTSMFANASTSELTISGLTGSTQCLHVDTKGFVTGTGSDCGSSGGGLTSYDAFTHPQTGTSATTSRMIFNNASSTFTGGLSVKNGTTTNATSTNLFVSGRTRIASLTGLALTTSGVVSAYGGTSCTNQFPRSLNASGVASCASVANTDLANSTISGVALGSNLAAHTTNSSLTGTSYNGSAAVSDWGLNLGHTNTWTILQNFSFASSTGVSSGYASSSRAVFGKLTLPSQFAASGNNCLQVDTSGVVTKTGSACGGAGSSPGGSEGQLQYNHSSAFTGAANLWFVNSTGFFGIGTSSPNTAFTVGSSTAINIAEYKYGAGATATSTTMYIGMASSSNQLIRLGTSATTLKISKYHLYAGEHITVTTCTGGSAGSASNAWSNLHYSGGVAPGFTTTANQCDKWFISATAATSSVIATLDGMLPGFQ